MYGNYNLSPYHMKKFYALILLSILFLLPEKSHSQFLDMSIGIRGGISLSSYTRDIDFGTQLIDESSSSNNAEQFAFGLSASVKTGIFLGLQGELMFMKKGGIYESNLLLEENLTPVSRDYKTTLDYIQISLIPKLVLDQTPVFGFFAGVGGYAAFLTKAYEEVKESTFQQERLAGRDISNSIAKTEMGLVFIGGVNFNSFTIEAKYNLGLTNIIDNPAIPEQVSAKTRTLSFLIGYNFSI